MAPAARAPLALLIALQAIDGVVHLATGQVEPIRLTSNAVLCLGALAAVMARARRQSLIAGAGLVYLALNIAFLIRHGLVNASTESLRLPLFGFVLGSLLALDWLRRRRHAPDA